MKMTREKYFKSGALQFTLMDSNTKGVDRAHTNRLSDNNVKQN